MTEIITGIVVLTGLVALRAGMERWTLHRAARAWEMSKADMAAGDLAAAEQRLSTCVRLAPLWLPGRYAYGAVLAALGKLDAAEEQFKAGPILEPRDPQSHIELGVFYITAARRVDDGLAKLRDALKLDAGVLSRLELDPRLADFRATEAFDQLRAKA